MNWGHLVAIIGAVLFPFAASPVVPTPCQKGFKEIGEVENSLSKILTYSGTAQAELQRLDRVLASEINQSLQNTPSQQRFRLLRLVEEAEKRHPFGAINGGMDSGNYGAVSLKPNETLRLELQERVLNHPLGRIVLRHEFSHMSRLDLGEVAPGAALKNVNKLTRTQLDWQMKEEAQAFGDQYDFIRKAYRASDVEKLKTEYPTQLASADHELLISNGIINKKADGTVTYRIDGHVRALLKNDPAVAAAFGRAMRGTINLPFIDMVENAFKYSKDDYIKYFLSSSEYKSRRIQDRALWSLHKVSIGSAFLGLGAGAYKVKEMLSSSDSSSARQ